MRFETGVDRYIVGEGTVKNNFPVQGNKEYVDCYHCNYYSYSTRRCRITDEAVAFPDKYVGGRCPFLENEFKEMMK